MNKTTELYRMIPKMDTLLARKDVLQLISRYSLSLVTNALRNSSDEVRAEIQNGRQTAPSAEDIVQRCEAFLNKLQRPHQRSVINATGIPLHTNLGRSLLAECAAEAVKNAAINYTNLEFDCNTGSRGNRGSHVEGLLKELLDAESAIVVNNNAAAALLILSALAKEREVVVSRGELVEIGGSFRVPEVMEQSGCILHEVGATNKTHPSDYEKAINENTAALLKVHTSNYRMIGFTSSVSLEIMSEIAKNAGIPLIYDLGSGALLSLDQFGLNNEPTVKESLASGADVICFSGDKLLGGPQAGIIVGKKRYLDLMKKHPLTRALRVDKLTLAALEATLRLYRDPSIAVQKIPLYSMLSQSSQTLRERATNLKRALAHLSDFEAEVIDTASPIGGGSAPGEIKTSIALALKHRRIGVDTLSHRLMQLDRPVIARINEDRLLLDMRTVRDSDHDEIVQALSSAADLEDSHE